MAAIIGQGLSGTVDLRTIRPLDIGKRVISVGARGVYTDGRLNPEGSHGLARNACVYKLNGTLYRSVRRRTSQSAMVTRCGLGTTSRIRTEGVKLLGICADRRIRHTNAPAFVIGGAKSYATSTELKRLGLTGTLAVQATDAELHLDDRRLLLELQGRPIKRGIEVAAGCRRWLGNRCSRASPSTDGHDHQRHVHQYRMPSSATTSSSATRSSTRSAGTTRFDDDDGWHGLLPTSAYSKTNRNELDFESYAGTGAAWRRCQRYDRF